MRMDLERKHAEKGCNPRVDVINYSSKDMHYSKDAYYWRSVCFERYFMKSMEKRTACPRVSRAGALTPDTYSLQGFFKNGVR